MRSVWSRVSAGWTAVVTPSQNMPASSTALFTWALGTSGAKSMGRSALVPWMVNGGRPSSESIAAPIRSSGWMMRRIGRRLSEESPVMVELNG